MKEIDPVGGGGGVRADGTPPGSANGNCYLSSIDLLHRCFFLVDFKIIRLQLDW